MDKNMKLKKLCLLVGLMFFMISTMGQSVLSIHAVEKQTKDKWVPQYYLVVVAKGTNNITVVFDAKKNVISSVAGKNVRVGLPNTNKGNYRVTRLQ
jgi:hypothetical protein